MAARVTKLFLQNCASAKVDTSKSAKKQSGKNRPLNSSSTLSKSARRKLRQKNKKVSSKSKVKVLEEARREMDQANRAAQNIRKLKTNAPAKSQRLMAKVLVQRSATFR